MRAEIITVGTEILLGDIVNTNSRYLARELALLGIEVYYQGSVGDNEDRLLEAFGESLKRSDLVITTGGLGPTLDDITKEVAAKYFGQKMELNQKSWDEIREFMSKLDKSPTENNKRQAYFPKEATILKNNNGTAPGAIFKKDNKTIIVLPGPPREMVAMFEESVRPYLENLTEDILVSKTLRLYGIGESKLETELLDVIKGQTNPTVAPYASDMEVTLRITAKAKSSEEATKLIGPMEESIRTRVGKYIYGEGDTSLDEVVSKILVEKNLKIAVAESCTGGMVSASLINYPGISSVFMEGLITYSNEAKMERLGVKKETLDKFGAVSEETAIEMAQGVCKKFNTNVGVSTTGVAGPGGGTDEKPVGLVYIGVCINGKTKVKKLNLSGNRFKVRQRAAKEALNELRILLLEL
ncbi:competence/damage-inducible protein A [Asaccharospora irregularis]|uniref:Putative competence-damage inducible protein n=1 Tax=Asaccharospora irregularis DSM 2635 TaxID=1121321 RepID=A0A1M5NRT4_9FIRM|nr:competence/damage-inducible protein A [Asaccharospora irregularis]SHG91899.1 nicotinamide-nucleotide amidase [Asaccharospora irregularis DSM 2635]